MTEIYDIEEEIINCLEWNEEDQGIGHYEFWGMRERDVNIQPVLEYNEVSIELDNTKTKDIEGEWIPLYFERHTEAWVGERSYSVSVRATLVKVELLRYDHWKITYEVDANQEI